MDNEQVIDAGMQDQAPIEASDSQVNAVSAESHQQTQAEKMFSQAQTQAIAAKEARKAEERAEARVRAEYEGRASQQQPTTQQQPQNVGGIPQIPTEELQRMIRQEAFNMSRENQIKKIEQDWYGAMDAEKAADPEFADLYDAIGIERQPLLILAMDGMENKAQVVKDLAKNPSKYANIITLANGGSPKLAQLELNKLSASIKTNEDAKKQPKVDAPLSQIKSSNIGGDDGKMSVSDFQQQDWLRG